MIRRALTKLVVAPAVLVWALVFAGHLRAQETPAGAANAETPGKTASPTPPAFDVVIDAPKDIRELLQRHLELMRYRELADLDKTELERLLIAAERDARELLATQGYFSPELKIQLLGAPSDASTRRQVSITVQTGPTTRVSDVTIDFSGAIADDATAQAQRDAIRNNWSLPAGMRFTQSAWDAAKTEALLRLSAQRYAAARFGGSRADIDPVEQSARLSLTLDSGPAYRLGKMRVTGLDRHDSVLVERLALLSPGAEYDRTELLEAQQRLQSSGYFDSVYLSLDTAGDPAAAPILAQLREAQTNKLVLGLGYSTDSGARVSVEHTNHRLPWLGWRSVSNLLLDTNTQSIGTELMAMPDEDNWRWMTGALLKQETANDVKVGSVSLRAGRTQFGIRLDQNYFVQYDIADTSSQGQTIQGQSISANYAWTMRNFDSVPFPTSGYGLGGEIGGGWTLGGDRLPFARVQLRWLGIWPLPPSSDQTPLARSGRIAVRAQGGAVVANSGADLPGNQLFLTGGDATVRGYKYLSIGSTRSNGLITPGRYLAVGSVEWQHPITIDGQPSDWESAVFVDAGAVADKVSDLNAQVGVGVGARWRSPVGPLQLDLAYGVAVKQWRLYLSVGFTF